MLENLEAELNNFAKSVVQKARANAQKKSASGKLADSIYADLRLHKQSFSLEFWMTPYGEFVDKGVSGKKKKYNTPFSYKDKMPPSNVFLKWIKIRGIKGRDKKGRFISNKSLSFLIARSVFNKGLKPSLFFTKPFTQEFKGLSDELVEAFGLDIDNFLKYTLDKYE